MISSIAALGVFVSVPVIGAAMIGNRRLTVSRIASVPVIVAVALLFFGLYNWLFEKGYSEFSTPSGEH